MKSGYKTKYTRHTYSRGAMIRRDYVLEAIVTPHCESCGKSIERGVRLNGLPTEIRNWLRKKTCGKIIVDKKLVNSPCMKKWREIPKNNPMYKGIMDIPCRVCGKKGLSYRNTGTKYDLCGECWNANRGLAYNRKEDVMIKCTGCSKEISNRFKNGTLRYKTPFCSKACANRFHFKKDLVRQELEPVPDGIIRN